MSGKENEITRCFYKLSEAILAQTKHDYLAIVAKIKVAKDQINSGKYGTQDIATLEKFIKDESAELEHIERQVLHPHFAKICPIDGQYVVKRLRKMAKKRLNPNARKKRVVGD